MNVLIINCILYTAEYRRIAPRASVADCMICHVARGFQELGHRVTVLAAADFRPTRDEDLGFPIVYLRSSLRKLFPPAVLPWLPGLRRWLKRNASRFDLVVSSEMLSLATFTACRVCPDRLLVWHELDVKPQALFRIPAHLWYGVVVPLFMRRCFVAPRSLAARRFLLAQGVRKVAVNLVDHGVDQHLFAPSDELGNAFVVVSQLVPRKRVDRIIAAFADFLRQHTSACRLTVIGDGSERENLERLVQELGLEEAVTFTGRLDHKCLASHLRQAIALLVYTIQDLNMVSIAEALACGTPVLTNTMPTSAETIQQLKLGIVKDDWGAAELEQMIAQRQQFRQSCIAHREMFTSTGCAAALIRTFNQLNGQEPEE